MFGLRLDHVSAVSEANGTTVPVCIDPHEFAFDTAVRRKPLAGAADAGCYGNSDCERCPTRRLIYSPQRIQAVTSFLESGINLHSTSECCSGIFQITRRIVGSTQAILRTRRSWVVGSICL